jgi:hypothetical protein
MKYEWKKQEKNFYLPKNSPEIINIPSFNFFTIEGEGDPNSSSFSNYVEVLYSLSYAIRMSHKSGLAPKDYYEYTVYPLEGVWDINDNAKKSFSGIIDKSTLVFKLMIRQPNFVSKDFANQIIEITKIKKPHDLLDLVKFETIEEGTSIQMLHLGSFDTEKDSFNKMELFAKEKNLKRKCLTHREIYLSDPRKIEPDKLKTVLRFQVE